MQFFQIVIEEDMLQKKVAAVKSEKLKVFVIKYYDISKIYFVQFHLLCSVNLPYFCYSWFSFINS